MSRLPPLRHEDLEPEALSVWDLVVEPRGDSAIDERGGLVGPFNAWAHAPRIGRLLVELVSVLRYETALDRRLVELAILVTGGHWKAEFEWWAHEPMARANGLSDDVIAAIREDRTPQFESDADAIAHAVARQLAATGTVDESLYGDAVAALGARGTVELISVCGFYALVSFTLNAFEVGLPAGATPFWPASDQPTDRG